MGDGGTNREWVGAGFVSIRFDKGAVVGVSNGAGFGDISASRGLRPEDSATSSKNVRVCKKNIRESLDGFNRRDLPLVALYSGPTPHSMRDEPCCCLTEQNAYHKCWF